jgi:hypothetical protein
MASTQQLTQLLLNSHLFICCKKNKKMSQCYQIMKEMKPWGLVGGLECPKDKMRIVDEKNRQSYIQHCTVQL